MDDKDAILEKISARTSSFLVRVTEFIRSKQHIFGESLVKLNLVETRASMGSMKKIVPLLTRLMNEQQWYAKVKDQINEGKIILNEQFGKLDEILPLAKFIMIL